MRLRDVDSIDGVLNFIDSNSWVFFFFYYKINVKKTKMFRPLSGHFQVEG